VAHALIKNRLNKPPTKNLPAIFEKIAFVSWRVIWSEKYFVSQKTSPTPNPKSHGENALGLESSLKRLELNLGNAVRKKVRPGSFLRRECPGGKGCESFRQTPLNLVTSYYPLSTERKLPSYTDHRWAATKAHTAFRNSTATECLQISLTFWFFFSSMWTLRRTETSTSTL